MIYIYFQVIDIDGFLQRCTIEIKCPLDMLALLHILNNRYNLQQCSELVIIMAKCFDTTLTLNVGNHLDILKSEYSTWKIYGDFAITILDDKYYKHKFSIKNYSKTDVIKKINLFGYLDDQTIIFVSYRDINMKTFNQLTKIGCNVSLADSKTVTLRIKSINDIIVLVDILTAKMNLPNVIAQRLINSVSTEKIPCESLDTQSTTTSTSTMHRANADTIDNLINLNQFEPLMNYVEYYWETFNRDALTKLLKNAPVVVMHHIIDNMLDINICDWLHSKSFLHHVVEYCPVETMVQIVQHMICKVCANNNKVCANNNKVCMDSNIDINHVENVYLQTPLHIACNRGLTEVATMLINAGANLERADVYLQTPLHITCSKNATETAIMLINAGANLECIDKQFHKPIYYACCTNNVALVKILLEKNVNIHYLTGYGRHLTTNNNIIDLLKSKASFYHDHRIKEPKLAKFVESLDLGPGQILYQILNQSDNRDFVYKMRNWFWTNYRARAPPTKNLRRYLKLKNDQFD